jgi:superoxide dismutase, Fe-Mn family
MLKALAVLLFLAPTISCATTRTELNRAKAPFTLPELGYAANALSPVIDEATMNLHHGKHHKAYVDNLNAALAAQDKSKSLLEILGSISKYPDAVRNNGGGHWNHSFFWTVMKSEELAAKTKISPSLRKDLEKSFGSVENFKKEFEAQAKGVFGAGWAWLIKTDDGKLAISKTANQDNPLMDLATVRGKPVLALDVWEHAYYLTYQNKRAEYVSNFWRIVDWNQVSKYHAEK